MDSSPLVLKYSVTAMKLSIYIVMSLVREDSFIVYAHDWFARKWLVVMDIGQWYDLQLSYKLKKINKFINKSSGLQIS